MSAWEGKVAFISSGPGQPGTHILYLCSDGGCPIYQQRNLDHHDNT